MLVGRRTGDGLVYEPVNACIRLLASVDLCHVVTVEHVGRDGGAAPGAAGDGRPATAASAASAPPASSMSLYALWMRKPQASEAEIEEALQGNLCRCTGYQPIIAAAKAAGAAPPAADPLVAERARGPRRGSTRSTTARASTSAPATTAWSCRRPSTTSPRCSRSTRRRRSSPARPTSASGSPSSCATSPRRSSSATSPTSSASRSTPEGVTIGAGVSYDDFQAMLDAEFPHVADYWRRIGGWQVRAMGTVGGNIANGSPIGDTPPALIALGATVTLRKGDGAADPAARGVLHRLRQAGPATRRIR